MAKSALSLLAFVFYLMFSFYVKIVNEPNIPENLVVFQFIISNRLQYLNDFMILLSKYGREYFWTFVVILLWVFGKEKEKKSSILMALGFIIAIIFGEFSKMLIMQPRPSVLFYLIPEKLNDYSYPSGHALIVATGAIIALLMLPLFVSIPLLIEAIAVSYSRIYIGVHWPIDILGGWILGIAIALFAVSMYEKIDPVYNLLIKTWNKIVKFIHWSIFS
ncbi:MAG: phosphatase PAP2 family protein [Thermoprotei archaeon]